MALPKTLSKSLTKLSLADLEKAQTLIEKLIEEASTAPDVPNNPGRKVVKTEQRGTVTYRLEFVRCGKKGCKCETGDGHGPYFYGFYRAGGKLKSKYIGKEFKEFTPKD